MTPGRGRTWSTANPARSASPLAPGTAASGSSCRPATTSQTRSTPARLLRGPRRPEVGPVRRPLVTSTSRGRTPAVDPPVARSPVARLSAVRSSAVPGQVVVDPRGRGRANRRGARRPPRRRAVVRRRSPPPPPGSPRSRCPASRDCAVPPPGRAARAARRAPPPPTPPPPCTDQGPRRSGPRRSGPRRSGPRPACRRYGVGQGGTGEQAGEGHREEQVPRHPEGHGQRGDEDQEHRQQMQ